MPASCEPLASPALDSPPVRVSLRSGMPSIAITIHPSRCSTRGPRSRYSFGQALLPERDRLEHVVVRADERTLGHYYSLTSGRWGRSPPLTIVPRTAIGVRMNGWARDRKLVIGRRWSVVGARAPIRRRRRTPDRRARVRSRSPDRRARSEPARARPRRAARRPRDTRPAGGRPRTRRPRHRPDASRPSSSASVTPNTAS